jgi:hypothetical protein
VIERPPAPCAHRLGEPTKRQCRGRAMSLHGADRRSPADVPSPRSLDLALRFACLALTGVETPRAFHGSDRQPGDRPPSSIERPTGSKDAATEGSPRPFGLREPLHPFAKRMTAGPVRAICLPVAWRFAPRRALRLSLDAPPRCFESASTTDVYSRAPTAKTPSSETARRAPPGKPRGVPRRDPPRRRGVAAVAPRKTPDHLAVIRPPTAPCFDGTSPASGRLAVARALSRSAGERSSFIGCLTLRRPNPLTPPGTIETERVNALLPSLFPLPQAARQCCPLSRDRGAFHRGSPDRAPSRAPAWSSAPVGRRAQLLHVFIDVRKTSTRPFFAPLSRASPGRMRFHDFCRSMFQRALPWTARTSRTSGNRGRDGCRFDRSLPFDRRRPPRVRRVRGRGSPSLGAPSRDCSRERLRPNPDRLRHLVSRALPVTRSGVDVGDGRSRQRRARLQGMSSERAVRRPISAKRSDVHQPEGPSVARPFENGVRPFAPA